jgi:hypothetical protein
MYNAGFFPNNSNQYAMPHAGGQPSVSPQEFLVRSVDAKNRISESTSQLASLLPGVSRPVQQLLLQRMETLNSIWEQLSIKQYQFTGDTGILEDIATNRELRLNFLSNLQA